MAARSTRMNVSIKIWVPPQFTANHKFEVIREDGTVDDLTFVADKIEIEDGVTEIIGRFKAELWNPNETFTGVWVGTETVKYYSDYAKEATTQRFQGKIEKVLYRNNKIIISGRSESAFFMDETITASFINTDCSDILKSINTITGGAEFSTNNVAQSGVTLTVDWQEKPFWEAVQELTQAAGFDVYIDFEKDWHFFESGSVTNDGEGIAYNYNLLDVNDNGNDITLVKNKIIVYGAKQGGIQIIDSDDDFDSQTKFGVRKEVINDDNITIQQQAKDLARFRLAQKRNPTFVGEVTGTLLGLIQPGEKIHVGAPQDNLNDGTYKIQSYLHKLDVSRGYTTIVRIDTEPRKLKHVVKDMIQRENLRQDTNLNPFGLTHSFNHLYDSDSGVHSKTEIVGGVLKLQVGQSNGIWTSETVTADSEITEVYILSVGTLITGATYEISVNGGLNYVTVDRKELTILSINLGKSLKVRVTIATTSTEVDSLSVLYK